MHGLVNRAIQCFYRDTYGQEAWADLARALELPFAEFEPMMHYDDRYVFAMIEEIARSLEKPAEAVLEDLGTYLVSHPNVEALRRLLRFSGDTFVEFLHSLEDLQGRAQLAVDDLVMPELELREHGNMHFSLICRSSGNGIGHVFLGILRTMADDYGALVFLEHRGAEGVVETIEITVFVAEYSAGRHFDLAAEVG